MAHHPAREPAGAGRLPRVPVSRPPPRAYGPPAHAATPQSPAFLCAATSPPGGPRCEGMVRPPAPGQTSGPISPHYIPSDLTWGGTHPPWTWMPDGLGQNGPGRAANWAWHVRRLLTIAGPQPTGAATSVCLGLGFGGGFFFATSSHHSQTPANWRRPLQIGDFSPSLGAQPTGAAYFTSPSQHRYLTAYTTRLVTSVVCRGSIPARGDIAIRQPAPEGFSPGAVASLLRCVARRPIRIQLRRAGQNRRVPARILT
ncbi:hypothetical protein N7483_008139 [Penicillium malachiteum]|nr:hypothetical protein N7483_008139 [Penicillium malachiteum]